MNSIKIIGANYVDANYIDTGVSRFKGNPFIEALPEIEKSKSDFITSLSHYPQLPTDATRRSGEIVRIMEMSSMNDIVIPFPEYLKAGIAVATIIRDTYVARDPLTPLDRQRRHVLAARGADGLHVA